MSSLKVPNVPIMEKKKENGLCNRYLDPLLCGLFDDPDSDVFFRWTNARPKEAKDENSDLTSERADAVISSLNSAKWSSSQGFGEAKCSDEPENIYLTSMDLVRLDIFSKSSIDRHSMRNVQTLQAIGTPTTFYITIYTHDSLYIMYEIAEILAPRCVDDVLKYLMNLNKFVL
ncbi:hypothetical protein BCV72DRAFT_309874 [Rhizopus microsporus var. microsporus]|uniref:Uncharacterized protein n=2 Tax=Rhizopus microsporus TaxID=58291 RepID=A0A2G4SNC5_RHIZD|nr:uncharacterized protein RHIMIDRAFT_245605 [Rhizopus microsporus ATCC 52813]ORE01595.1 hypothetical protein BCV72DRAFT_309874 [Rhizopus microsporus var. microsporus]PHZ09886.1 hypothetical protein RHIMIDRAFT_245605 [Rhizopus microsporus ATCC 52813]